MARVLETFEFPHGGRKGMEYDFESLCDGRIHQLDSGDDFPVGENQTPAEAAETFLGALSRYANKKGYRVRKDIAVETEGGPAVVTVNVNPKKQKDDAASANGSDSDSKAVEAGKKVAAKK
jgi:hypothetical protein